MKVVERLMEGDVQVGGTVRRPFCRVEGEGNGQEMARNIQLLD